MTEIAPLNDKDYGHWLQLAQGYMAFYETPRPDADYHHLWQRICAGKDILAIGAKRDGQLLGFAHYLFHASAWGQDVCYLQDLFVGPAHRRQGVARALVGHVAAHAKQRNSTRLYWLTHQHNATARHLYDKLATHSGFIRYEMPL